MKSLPATDICLYFVRQDTVYSYLRIYVRCRHTAPLPFAFPPPRFSHFSLLRPTHYAHLANAPIARLSSRFAYITSYCATSSLFSVPLSVLRIIHYSKHLRPSRRSMLRTSFKHLRPAFCGRSFAYLPPPHLPFSRRHRNGSLQPPFGRRSRCRTSALHH